MLQDPHVRDSHSSDVTRIQLAAKKLGEELTEKIGDHPELVRWIVEANRHQSQTEIANIVRAISEGQTFPEALVPSSVQEIVKNETALHARFSVVRFGVHKVLHQNVPPDELSANLHHARSAAASSRRQTVRHRSTESDWTDEEILGVIHAMQQSAESSADNKYMLGEVLASIGFEELRPGDPLYDRFRHKIQKIASSVSPFGRESYNPTVAPLSEGEGVILLRVLRLKSAIREGNEPDWSFILSNMTRELGREVTKDECMGYISSIRLVSYSKRGKARKKP